MQYRTYQDLIADTQQLIRQLKDEYKAVLFVPRSGAIPATIIAQHFGVQVFSVNEFLTAVPLTTYSHREQLRKEGKVLVVDDSVHAGRRMRKVKEQLARFPDTYEYEYAAVYVGGSRGCVDYFYRVIKQPRMFEWNMYGHSYLKDCGSDIDGVICYDPPCSDAQNQARYEEWLPNAEPYHLFTAPIGFLVTSRLELYRKETEAWLKKYNVRYGTLYMSQFATAQKRRAAGQHADAKAAIYRHYEKARMFIESDHKQAMKIHNITGRPVFCVKSNMVLQ